MENASKALIITGGVFVAIVILVIGVELFVGYRNVAETYDSKMTESEISKINKEFTKYMGRNDITIQEVVTAIGTAKNYNEKHDEKIITVYLNSRDITNLPKEELTGSIKENLDGKYEISISYYEDESPNKGLVKKIEFI